MIVSVSTTLQKGVLPEVTKQSLRLLLEGGGGSLLCPLSSTLSIDSCGVINVCLVASSLRMFIYVRP